MAKLVTNTNTALMGTGMNVLAKLVPIADIKTIPELSEIFQRQSKVVEDIKKSMQKDGFHKEEPIVIAKLIDGTILGVADGNTRLMVAKEIGMDEVPIVYKTFDNLKDAIKYAKDRQFHRRNLSQAEIYNYANNLDTIEDRNGDGRATERLAKEIGVSASTLQHARTVAKKASDEVKEKIKNNKMTVNQGYQTVRKKKKSKNDNLEDDFDTDDEVSDLSDSLSDNSGTPQGLNFNHSDGIERPHYTVHPEDDTDRWIKEKNIQVESARKEGLEDGLKKGSDLAYEVYEYILSEIENGKTSEELRNDERFEDFSVMKIYKAFGISGDNKSGIEPQEK